MKNFKSGNLEISIKNLHGFRKLGEGQFGKVYLAEDRRYGTQLAVKEIGKEQIREE